MTVHRYSLDRYARAAERHMRTYLPARYHQIDDPEAYFTQLGEEIAAQVAALEVTLAATEPAATDYLARAGQLRAARMQAEEIVFSDLVYLPPERPDPTNPDIKTDETGTYIGWTDPTKKQIWAPDPPEDWELMEIYAGRDPATGQALFSDEEIEAKTVEATRRRACGDTPKATPAGQSISGPRAKGTWPRPGK